MLLPASLPKLLDQHRSGLLFILGSNGLGGICIAIAWERLLSHNNTSRGVFLPDYYHDWSRSGFHSGYDVILIS
jgi:hypothetical protein